MQIYEEVTPTEQEAEQNIPVYKSRRNGGSLVLLQAVLCLIVLLCAMLLKYLLPGFYDTLRERYDAEMQRSILISNAEPSDL